MTRRIVGPFNRVEGDLEVALDIDHGAVVAAHVNAPLFRGFEQILLGKDPGDALVLVPRICGICSVAQSAAAATALAAASGVIAPPNGRLAAAITQAVENAADHLTHFYLFFMPDFAHEAYRDQSWYPETAQRFAALRGDAAREVLTARTGFLRAMGLLAGKWPHTMSVQPGGSSRPIQASEKIRLHRIVRDFRGFLERVVYGGALEHVAALATFDALCAWAADRPGTDFARFLAVATKVGLHRLGRSGAVLISAGAYDTGDGPWIPAGIFDGMPGRFDADEIREDATRARYDAVPSVQDPARATTVPQVDKLDAYTWCKAPRLAGRVAETGALARQVVGGHMLLREMVASEGATALARVVARLVELARLVPELERWVESLTPGEPYFTQAPLPEEADTRGLVEAARGTLGHWVSIRRGRLDNYQIIAPTTWNFSPRDARGNPGPVEQALVGTPAGEGGGPAVFHVVRSFDPCMVCTVH